MNWSSHRGGGHNDVWSQKGGRHSTSAHDQRDDSRDAWAQYKRNAPPHGASNVPRPIHDDCHQPLSTPRVNAGAFQNGSTGGNYARIDAGNDCGFSTASHRYDDNGFHRDDGNHHHRGPPPMPNGNAFSNGNTAGKHAHNGARNASSNIENNCSPSSGNKRYKNNNRPSANS